MAQENFKVSDAAQSGLFLRSEPIVRENTKIAVLPMGHKVKKLSESDTPKWWKVSATLDGGEMTGFVNSTFLTADFVPPPSVSRIKGVHLTRPAAVKRSNTAFAFALNEAGQPMRDPNASTANKVAKLTKIVEWLDVESLNHLRYKRLPSATYCNIYAYDYCFLAKVYLPRVWWTARALMDLEAGRNVSPIYGQTVHELNANSLLMWLKDFGADFGWRRTASIDEMQTAANNGQVVIISAQNKIPNRSGHICAVVPETDAHRAVRSGGQVTKPLQSQAGARNFRYRTEKWWIVSAATFREHGFWIHER